MAFEENHFTAEDIPESVGRENKSVEGVQRYLEEALQYRQITLKADSRNDTLPTNCQGLNKQKSQTKISPEKDEANASQFYRDVSTVQLSSRAIYPQCSSVLERCIHSTGQF
ncbi:hypothetical protein Btru_063681 [Bulinus truncatus]|nr:hypothetical protein Btru_063681 [Bulinus truncatus]